MTTHYGIIGCGMMGCEHIRNLALVKDARVSVIFEPDAAMESAAAALVPDAAKASSLDELLDHSLLDCVVIASPNHLHLEQLEHIAGRARLPVLVEKPLFTEAGQLDRIHAFARAYSALVWVGMEYRYMPPMKAFLEQVGAATGGVRMLTITEHRFPFLEKVGRWNMFNANSGGTFVEKCCHFFDLMRLVLDADPVRVMASGGQEVNGLDDYHEGRRRDVWDCGYVLVDFATGARAMLELSMFAEGSRYQEMIHAIGPEGKIEVRIPGPSRFAGGEAADHPVPSIVSSPRSGDGPTLTRVPVDGALLAAGDHNGATYHQHLKFIDAVRGGGDVEVGLDDGIWAVRMGQAAERSARDGKAVTI